MNILESQTTLHVEQGQVQWHAEASTLGLPPGSWPQEIVMTMDDGDGALVTLTRTRSVGGEDLMAVIYTSNTGHELHVLND
jgi:hypothetical protein